MITTLILNIAYYFVLVLFSVFPTSSGFPPEVLEAITQISGYTALINTLVPMDTLGRILILVTAFELTVFAWKGLRFIVGYIPLVGGRG